MGRKTYDTLQKPLLGRINLILTENKKLHSNIIGKLQKDIPYYISLKQFEKIYKKYNPNIFIIGGSEIYNYFLSSSTMKPQKLYITHVQTDKLLNVKYTFENEPNIFMNNFDDSYINTGYSEKFITMNYSYRVLFYNLSNKRSQEHSYLNLAKYILENGKERSDRTGINTIGIFGAQLRFDISNGNLPLLTTKQVPLKAIIEELLFFCQGNTDAKILDKKGVKIWNSNTSREFLNKRGLSNYPEGCMGPMYGFSWRHFGAKYSSSFSDTSKIDTNLIGGVDQLAHVEHLLKTDPFSRRIYISNLNPAESQNMCLEPCHTYIQFYVEEINGVKYLSAYFTLRSSDTGCGFAFNLISYVLLVNILALKSNMKPKEIIYNAVDCHIYTTHKNQIKEQITRAPRPTPRVIINESIKSKDWSEMEYSDFELIGYYPHASIKMPMAI